MSFKGRKVADIFVELNLDKDELRRGMASAAGEMGADADRMGKSLGDRMTAGIAQKVEALSQKVVKSRQAESKAADDVKLAELRLSEARDKGGQKASTLLALEQKLTQAQLKLADSSRASAVAVAQHEAAQRRLGQAMADDIENIGKKVGKDAEKAGDDAGSKLAVAMQMSFLKASPLIAAAVGGALAAGAPVALAGATALFAGIGVLAAFQSNAVKSAWLGTWQQVKAGTVSAASSIEPVLTRVAGNVGAAFQKMQPQITTAFSAAAPQIDQFSRGVINLAQNTLPGLVRAVQAGMPVTQGLADFLGKTGTGLSSFFDKISSHGPAAGQVFSQLGTTVQTILPTLGELIGQGVELGAQVLPLFNGVLGTTLSLATALGPALPAVAAGFGAFRVVSLIAGPMEKFAGTLGGLASKDIPFLSKAAGGAQSALGGIAGALPALGVGVGILSAAWSSATRQLDDWSQALVDGGQKAATATQEMSDAHSRSILDAHSLGDAWGIVKGAFADGTAQLEGYDSAQAKASAGAKDLLAAMDPVSRAQAVQQKALDDLNFALEKHGAGSASAEVAERNYKAASDAVTTAEGLQEQAIHGVTKAMEDQANEALAAIDSGIALRRAATEATQAEKDYQQVLATGKVHLNDNSTATLDYETKLSALVAASGKAAADASGLTDKLDLQKVSTAAQLKTLYDLRAELGTNFPASMQAAITKLEGLGVTTDAASGKLDDLGAKNPKPTIGPAADNVTPQVNNLMNSLFNLGAAHPVPQADLDIAPGARNKDVMIGMLAHLGAQRPTPVAGLDPGGLPGTTNNLLGQMWNLGAQRPTPVAGVADYASGPLQWIRGLIDSLYSKTIYVTTVHQDIGTTGRGTAGLALGGNVGRAVRGFADGGAPRRRSDGRIIGPGGPWDDMVPAVTSTGEQIRVANDEWVVPGFVASMQGDRRMEALTSGRADIVPRRPTMPRSALGATSVPAPAAAGPTGGVVINGGVTVQLAGTYDFTDPGSMRKAAQVFRDQLIRLEREQQ